MTRTGDNVDFAFFFLHDLRYNFTLGIYFHVRNTVLSAPINPVKPIRYPFTTISVVVAPLWKRQTVRAATNDRGFVSVWKGMVDRVDGMKTVSFDPGFLLKRFLVLQDNVLDELRTYDNGEHSSYMPYLRNSIDRRSTAWWPGSFTAHEAFDVSRPTALLPAFVLRLYFYVCVCVFFLSEIRSHRTDQRLRSRLRTLG